MPKFSTKGAQSADSAVSKWIPAPSVAKASIVAFEYFESSQKKTPGIKVTIMTEPVEGVKKHDHGEGQICRVDDWWLSPKAAPYTIGRLCLIADKAGFRDRLDELSAAHEDSSAKQFVEAVQDLFVGVEGIWLIYAEQVWMENRDGDGNGIGTYSEWMKPVVAGYGFFATIKDAESIEARFAKASNKVRYSEKPGSDSPAGSADAGSVDEDVTW